MGSETIAMTREMHKEVRIAAGLLDHIRNVDDVQGRAPQIPLVDAVDEVGEHDCEADRVTENLPHVVKEQE